MNGIYINDFSEYSAAQEAERGMLFTQVNGANVNDQRSRQEQVGPLYRPMTK